MTPSEDLRMLEFLAGAATAANGIRSMLERLESFKSVSEPHRNIDDKEADNVANPMVHTEDDEEDKNDGVMDTSATPRVYTERAENDKDADSVTTSSVTTSSVADGEKDKDARNVATFRVRTEDIEEETNDGVAGNDESRANQHQVEGGCTCDRPDGKGQHPPGTIFFRRKG